MWFHTDRRQDAHKKWTHSNKYCFALHHTDSYRSVIWTLRDNYSRQKQYFT